MKGSIFDKAGFSQQSRTLNPKPSFNAPTFGCAKRSSCLRASLARPLQGFRGSPEIEAEAVVVVALVVVVVVSSRRRSRGSGSSGSGSPGNSSSSSSSSSSSTSSSSSSSTLNPKP